MISDRIDEGGFGGFNPQFSKFLSTVPETPVDCLLLTPTSFLTIQTLNMIVIICHTLQNNNVNTVSLEDKIINLT